MYYINIFNNCDICSWRCKWLFTNWVIIVSILGGIVAVVFAILLIQTLKKKGKAKNERNERLVSKTYYAIYKVSNKRGDI